LLTVFFFCKSADVASFLLAKNKVSSVCKTENCESEKSEVEKGVDDQQLIHTTLAFTYPSSTVPVKTVFSYSVQFENEIFKNLFSPPPEQA
jgi:hypothetical protein